MNFTITVPEGTTNRGNPELLCIPAQWHNYIIFFFANYVAHAATTVPTPGRDTRSSIFAMFLALFIPGCALFRAVIVIFRRAATEKNPLKSAARAGALCIVLEKKRYEWFVSYEKYVEEHRSTKHRQAKSLATGLPKPGVRVGDPFIEMEEPRTKDHQIPKNEIRGGKEEKKQRILNTEQSLYQWWDPPAGYMPAGGKIHGQFWLHKDYYLAIIPPMGLPNLRLKEGHKPITIESAAFQQPEAVLSCNQNFLKLSISLVQSIWATITIYRARADQIQQYGYAAFGLTVAPYATMSIINTIANILTQEYPAIFVIRTPLLTELENEQKAFFNGALDVIIDSTSSQESFKKSKGWLSRLGTWLDGKFLRNAEGDSSTLVGFSFPILGLSFLLSLVPLAIVGGLSGFQQGNSTQMQRGFTMSWLVLGILYGHVGGFMIDMDVMYRSLREVVAEDKPWWMAPQHVPNLWAATVFLVFGAPVFGGMAMVVEMIGEFGVCTLLKD